MKVSLFLLCQKYGSLYKTGVDQNEKHDRFSQNEEVDILLIS